jgi:hypothetical protein
VPSEIIEVDPGVLRLPWSRRDGADPWKLQRQIAKHGKSVQGMPHLVGIRGKNGEIKLMDGVTRATRVAKLVPGQKVSVEITDEAPNSDFSGLPTVGDKLP